MTVQLNDLLELLEARALTRTVATEVRGGYIADLLSDVLANAEAGMLWVTIQTHRNVVSVAAMKDIGAVLITRSREPGPEVIAEADEEGITILTTPLSTYEAAGKLWETGIR
jgi:hypothetical protein